VPTSDRPLGATLTTLGGPTVLIELGGHRLLTDPTFDGPGEYPVGSRALVKTAPSALDPDEIGAVDVVLLSHDQHPDNLDHGGRAFLSSAPRTLSTSSAADRIGGPVEALGRWETVELPHAAGALRVTGVPAQHGPDGTEHLTGEVTGFLLRGDGLPTVYVSGDNASLDVVARVAEHEDAIDLAVLFAGGAQTPLIPGAYLTLTSAQAAEAAQILGPCQVVVVHTDSWAHFTETIDDVRTAFADAGLTDRLHTPAHGQALRL
jgi:L-ascorbate metabolism protein UlaG (beta-lactamase superfamily)